MNGAGETRQTRGKLLGIDHGAKVVGIAVCDATQMLARPLQLMTRSTRERDFATVNGLITAQQAVGIVVGLPETPENFDGVSQADTVQRWAVRLAGQVNIPVYLWEETFSTMEAENLIADSGLKRRDRVDDVAAAIILQSFLDAHPPGTPYPAAVKPRR